MRCLPKLVLLVPGIILLASVEGLAQKATYQVGRAASAEEMRALDRWIGPHGEGLPPGSGTAKEGEAIFQQKCSACHGKNAEWAPGLPVGKLHLVGGVGMLADESQMRTVGSFYPDAMSIWEFINAAMPPRTAPSLQPAEVYSLLAFLLNKNGIIKETDVLDAKSVPKVRMPNRDGFIPAVADIVYPAKNPGGCGTVAYYCEAAR